MKKPVIFSCDVFLWSRGKNLMPKKRKTGFFLLSRGRIPCQRRERLCVEVNTTTKTKGINMELMESIVKVDMEINYV
jgi:hypothetical protein